MNQSVTVTVQNGAAPADGSCHVNGSGHVYVIGARWRHHAEHGGYDHFARHAGIRIKPVRLPSLCRDIRRLGHFDGRVSCVLAALHMATKRDAIFHALAGDRDLELLSPFSGYRGNRLIATLHNPPSCLPRLSLERQIERLHAAILVSHSQRDWFHGLLAEERVFVVPHGVDTRFFSPSPRPRTRGSTLITAGDKLRDFPALTRALQRVWRERPGVELIAVGFPPSAKRALTRIDAGQTTFMDAITDTQLRSAYRQADAAVFAFEDATANNSLLEAMACGLPLAATDVGGVREYAGSSALLCPPGDATALADAVIRLVDDSPLARRLGSESRGRSLAFSYSHVGSVMRDVYRRIAEELG